MAGGGEEPGHGPHPGEATEGGAHANCHALGPSRALQGHS